MLPMPSDPALYAMMEKGRLKGLSGTYVDDMVRCGDAGFRKISHRTFERFEMDEDTEPPCTFTGFRLSRDNDGLLSLDQATYVRQKMSDLSADATFSDFASIRMKLAWLSHSRPDVMFEVSQLTQVTADMFKEKRQDLIKRANKTVTYVRENEVSIKFPQLDMNSLHVVGYSDASFSMNADLSSQLGYIVFIGDKS